MADVSVDVQEFLGVFYEEAAENLTIFEESLLALEASPNDTELVNTIFRAAHSVKGGAAVFGLSDVASYTHHLEELLDSARSGKLVVNRTLLDVLLRGGDVMRGLVEASKSGTPIDRTRVDGSLAELRNYREASTVMPAPAVRAPEPDKVVLRTVAVRFAPGANTFREGVDPLLLVRTLASLGTAAAEVEIDRLPPLADLDPETSYLGWKVRLETAASDAEIREVFDFVADSAAVAIEPIVARPVAPGSEAPPSELPPSSELSPYSETAPLSEAVPLSQVVHLSDPTPPRATRAKPDASRGAPDLGPTLRVPTAKVDHLMNLVGEIVTAQAALRDALADGSTARELRLANAVEALEEHTRELQGRVLSVRMIAVGSVFGRFTRMARDLVRTLDKQADLELEGMSVEIDKGLAEQLVDPLTHLVRNALDHGIEPPAERVASGKSSIGNVVLRARHHAGSVVIEVEDDGRGLDPEKLRAKAIKLGIVSPDQAVSREELFQLVFAPGFSTAAKVTDISGRGVGLDVVKRNIEALHGTLHLTSEPGAGCRFRLALPLTLAVLDGLVVRVGSESFVLPLLSVVETLRPERARVRTVFGRGELLELRGESIALFRLSELFGLRAEHEPWDGVVCVVETDGGRVALALDEISGQMQVVVKALEAHYRRVEGFMGATVLGNGRVALILDPHALAAGRSNGRLGRPEVDSHMIQTTRTG